MLFPEGGKRTLTRAEGRGKKGGRKKGKTLRKNKISKNLSLHLNGTSSYILLGGGKGPRWRSTKNQEMRRSNQYNEAVKAIGD